MSTEITRMYANPATALKVAEDLREEGYDDLFVVNPPGSSDVPVSAIAAQITLGRVYLGDAKVYARGVAAGHALVTVHAPFGSGKLAEVIMDSQGPVDSGMPKVVEPAMWDDAAPLSSVLAMATLIDDPDPVSKIIGMPAVTSGDCSASGVIGMPLLTDSKMGNKGRLGLPYLSSKPTPLSSMLGLPLLSRR